MSYKNSTPALPILFADFIKLFSSIADFKNRDNNEIVITVTDTGQGISPENRDKIFNPFFSTKSVGKGTGLGLSVTLGILQDHGGTIDFESPPSTVFPWMANEDIPSEGTMFIIKLPIDKNYLLGGGRRNEQDNDP